MDDLPSKRHAHDADCPTPHLAGDFDTAPVRPSDGFRDRHPETILARFSARDKKVRKRSREPPAACRSPNKRFPTGASRPPHAPRNAGPHRWTLPLGRSSAGSGATRETAGDRRSPRRRSRWSTQPEFLVHSALPGTAPPTSPQRCLPRPVPHSVVCCRGSIRAPPASCQPSAPPRRR